MFAVQMNTRLDAAMKASGDAVLERNGVTPSEAVRALWEYLGSHGTLPEFMRKGDRAVDSAMAEAEGAGEADEGAGFLYRYAADRGLVSDGQPLIEDSELVGIKEAIRDERFEDFVREVSEDDPAFL